MEPVISEFVKTVEEKGHRVLFLTKFGSHLYGTNTKNSDVDYKGIFFPSEESLLLNQAPRHFSYTTKKNKNEKNKPDDVDIQLWSIHMFREKLCKGEVNAVDLLFAPSNADAVCYMSDFYKEKIFNNRKQLVSKNVAAFTGYIYQQSRKYGIKGSRLGIIKELIRIIEDEIKPGCNDFSLLTIGQIKTALFKRLNPCELWKPIKMETGQGVVEGVSVVGKKFQDNVKLHAFLDYLKQFYERYGERARLAERNQGIDWKAMHHACRCVIQTEMLLTKHEIVFPFRGKDLNFLMKVKQGRCDFQIVSSFIEKHLKKIKELKEESTLPESVNSDLLNKTILEYYSVRFQKDFYRKSAHCQCPGQLKSTSLLCPEL